MFDFITRRRLIFALLICLFLTISILFIARLHTRVLPSYYEYLSSNNSIDKNQQISTCYQNEPVNILTSCKKCTSFEIRSQAVGCSSTNYKEFILCTKSNIKTFRSCPIPIDIQKKHFWIFEGIIFFLCLIFILIVHSRQKTLDKQMVEKIKRQIGESDE